MCLCCLCCVCVSVCVCLCCVCVYVCVYVCVSVLCVCVCVLMHRYVVLCLREQDDCVPGNPHTHVAYSCVHPPHTYTPHIHTHTPHIHTPHIHTHHTYIHTTHTYTWFVRSINCPQHTEDQRQDVRRRLLGKGGCGLIGSSSPCSCGCNISNCARVDCFDECEG